MEGDCDDRTKALLQELPAELITVLGSQMLPGDLLACRLVSRQWRELLRPAVSQACISPYLLLPPTAQQQQPGSGGLGATEAGTSGGRRQLRPRAAPPPSLLISRRRPPDVLLPPLDLERLPHSFPALRKVSMRVLSRHGQRGEGINSQPHRIAQLFAALAAHASPTPIATPQQPPHPEGRPAEQQQQGCLPPEVEGQGIGGGDKHCSQGLKQGRQSGLRPEEQPQPLPAPRTMAQCPMLGSAPTSVRQPGEVGQTELAPMTSPHPPVLGAGRAGSCSEPALGCIGAYPCTSQQTDLLVPSLASTSVGAPQGAPQAVVAAGMGGVVGGGGGGSRAVAGSKGVRGRGLHLDLELDIDVPRSRHKEAVAAALALARTTLTSLAWLGDMLQSLCLRWYEVNIPQLPEMCSCLSRLAGLTLLEVAMTPGAVLPLLAGLTGLTGLRIKTVGEEMHMGDLGLPRHTEVVCLSRLSRLTELALDGWVHQELLGTALLHLTGLKSLNLGSEIHPVQALPWPVLTRLTALSLAYPISLPDASDILQQQQQQQQQQLNPHASGGAGPEPTTLYHPLAPSSPSQPLRAHLPRLVVYAAPPPADAFTDGSATDFHPTAQHPPPHVTPQITPHVTHPTHDPIAAEAKANIAQQAASSGPGPPPPPWLHPPPLCPSEGAAPCALPLIPGEGLTQGSGAARRRQLRPAFLVPGLRRLVLDLGLGQELELGRLGQLREVTAKVHAWREEDLQALLALTGALARLAAPTLTHLELRCCRPHLLPPTQLLMSDQMQHHLRLAGQRGALDRLQHLGLTSVWEGLVPEQWDYASKGALRGLTAAAFKPSLLLPSRVSQPSHCQRLPGAWVQYS
ncbi:hypothetical protein V8C86DRAFT_322435 [Haematococcus lacustris]